MISPLPASAACLTLDQAYVYDNAWRPETRIINCHVLYAWLLSDATENSRRVPYTYESSMIYHQSRFNSTQLTQSSIYQLFIIPYYLYLYNVGGAIDAIAIQLSYLLGSLVLLCCCLYLYNVSH